MYLDVLAEEIRACRKCRLWEGAMNAVPGEGPEDALAMLIGQNPGAEEDREGRPFLGRSGRFLDSILEKNGLSRKRFFITGVVKHLSPGNRMPKGDETEACMPYTVKQIGLIGPQIVVLMGELAKKVPRQKGITYIATCHPAAAMRFPKYREIFERDIREFRDIYGRLSP